jgi:hypothetical protein
MLATFLTLAFLTAAMLATAVIAASLAKGLAAASSLRRQLAASGDVRVVTVKHQRAPRSQPAIAIRSGRRPVRLAIAPAPAHRRVAA